jgi:hypothetical protein
LNDLTLIEKIRREQQETAADLQRFIESEKRASQADIEAIKANELKNLELIERIEVSDG